MAEKVKHQPVCPYCKGLHLASLNASQTSHIYCATCGASFKNAQDLFEQMKRRGIKLKEIKK